MFLSKQIFKRCLFIDIETVSEYANYEEMSETKKQLWRYKATTIHKSNEELTEEMVAKLYENKAAIFAEFGKIVCISMGFLSYENEAPAAIRLKSIANDDECELLREFTSLLQKHYSDIEQSKICGHNIKEFDIPYMCRRLVIHGIAFPEILDIAGKKPWQTSHLLDTMDMWRFGDYKNYTSLALLANTLGIETPKDDIDGSMVGQVYYIENNLFRIVEYCQKDVVTVIQIVLKFAGLSKIEKEKIEYID